jgi:serine/threonine-protein phosphatase 4 regulatory subunit 2
MSDHPIPLTAVTTLPPHEPKPFLGSLEQRFVKANEMGEVDSGDGDAMVLDDDKENTKG